MDGQAVTALRSCLACGVEDRDVAMTLVEVKATEQRVVSVALVSAETSRGVTGFDYPEVRERYISEPRCRDKAACRRRVAELAGPVDAAPPPKANADEEGPSWLL